MKMISEERICLSFGLTHYRHAVDSKSIFELDLTNFLSPANHAVRTLLVVKYFQAVFTLTTNRQSYDIKPLK